MHGTTGAQGAPNSLQNVRVGLLALTHNKLFFMRARRARARAPLQPARAAARPRGCAARSRAALMQNRIPPAGAPAWRAAAGASGAIVGVTGARIYEWWAVLPLAKGLHARQPGTRRACVRGCDVLKATEGHPVGLWPGRRCAGRSSGKQSCVRADACAALSRPGPVRLNGERHCLVRPASNAQATSPRLLFRIAHLDPVLRSTCHCSRRPGATTRPSTYVHPNRDSYKHCLPYIISTSAVLLNLDARTSLRCIDATLGLHNHAIV